MIRTAALFVGLLSLSAADAADPWDTNENFIGFSIAGAHWSADTALRGTKLIIDGNYAIRQDTVSPPERDRVGEPLPDTDRMIATIRANLQWGNDETGLEYGYLQAVALAYQRNFELAGGRFERTRDTLEWGILEVGRDYPLGINSYVVFNVINAARTWGYRMSESSPWTFTVAVSLQGGWAWAESLTARFDDVSNPIIGTWLEVGIEHPNLGRLYLGQRLVNGSSFSGPEEAGTISREARATFGYRNRFGRALSLDIYLEKRSSFYFVDPTQLDLYTFTKRVGIELGWVF